MRHDVGGGRDKIIEYYGPGLQNLTAMDRHVMANIGTELGATTTVFPSDEETLLKTRKLLEAKFGIGSWQDVIVFHEGILQKQEAADEIDGQLTTLIQLTEYAINAGNKEKAREFVLKAERLLERVTAVDIEASFPQPMSISGEILLQLRRAEIQRLHNWVF